MLKYAIPLLLFVLAACEGAEQTQPLVYDGPEKEMENVELYHTENEKIKLKMKAPVIYEYLNGDREFPKGLNIDFFDETGKMTTTLHANEAFYNKEKAEWRGRGNVEVKNIQTNEQLNTEELFWKPGDQKIYTDKFVTIRQQNDVIYGEGLDAKDDMSDYRIHKVSGTLEIKEEN